MLDHIKEAARDLTSFVTFRMARTQNKLNAQAVHLLKTHSDLSLVEWRIIQLLRLAESGSLSDISAMVQMDKGQLSRKIARMIEKGLITSRPNAKDHRKHDLALTEKAQAISAEMMPLMQKRQAHLLAGVSDAELATFFNVLARIEAAAEDRDLA